MKVQLAIGALVFIVTTTVILYFLPHPTGLRSSKPAEPWMVYHQGFQEWDDDAALRHWIVRNKGAKCGIRVEGRLITLYLSTDPDYFTPRYELEAIAEEAMSRLPEGEGFEFKIETVEEAVARLNAKIDSLTRERDVAVSLHTKNPT